MGISNPEIQKKVFGPRWEHEIEKQGWPFWKRLMHRLQDCPTCKPKSQSRKLQRVLSPVCTNNSHCGVVSRIVLPKRIEFHILRVRPDARVALCRISGNG